MVIPGVFAFLYSSQSVLRYMHFRSYAFDLGIFDQAIWHYSRFEAPASTVRGYGNLLGDHFHPILILAAPVFWLWDDPRALLVLQALLIAASSVPIYLLAHRRFGTVSAAAWAVAYLLSWGLIQTVQFDFHEVAFAVPLVALACVFLVEGKAEAALVPIVALLLVKEDLSFLVAAFGVVYAIQRRWRLAAALVAGGLAWFGFATKVLIPAFAGGRGFRYWSYPEFGSGPEAAMRTIVTRPWLLVTQAVNVREKVSTTFYLFAPFAFLSLVSPLVVLMVPLLAERLYSNNPNYWLRIYQYSAVSVPVLAVGALDCLTRVRARFGLGSRSVNALSCMIVLLAVAGNFPIKHYGGNYSTAPFNELFRSWHLTTSDRAGNELVDMIPRNAAVLAQDPLVPHLTHRARIWLLPIFPTSNRAQNQNPAGGPPPARVRTERADYVAANVLLPIFYGGTRSELAHYLASLPSRGFGLVYSNGGWLLFRRGATSRVALSGQARRFFQLRGVRIRIPSGPRVKSQDMPAG